MALDILLAKEGGVHTKVGDQCCTYVPANDDAFGNISTALDQMKQVTHQLYTDELGRRSWGPLYNLFG